MEGTIINVEELHFKAFTLAAQEFGLSLTFENMVKEIPYALGGGDKRISRGIASKISGVSEKDILVLKRRFYSKLLDEQRIIKPRPGFKKVFE